jgi:hypothetical protein
VKISWTTPTADRRRFALDAIRMFMAQDYPDKGLIILDEADDSIADLASNDPSIRYVHEALSLAPRQWAGRIDGDRATSNCAIVVSRLRGRRNPT